MNDPLLQPTCHVRVATRRLTPLDEHILLGSETFWGLVSPDDAALRSHLHLKVRASRSGVQATGSGEYHVHCKIQEGIAAVETSIRKTSTTGALLYLLECLLQSKPYQSCIRQKLWLLHVLKISMYMLPCHLIRNRAQCCTSGCHARPQTPDLANCILKGLS